ncbi:MAG: hypothetical protein ILP02_04430 [Clostridia bacterium]|nr:hypothetical protein [Clostridia bacterium]
MKKLIKHILSLALVLTLSFSLSGCVLSMLRSAAKSRGQAIDEVAENLPTSKEYAVLYEDTSNNLYSLFKGREFTPLSPLEKGGFYEKGYTYENGYNTFYDQNHPYIYINGAYIYDSRNYRMVGDKVYIYYIKYQGELTDDTEITFYLISVYPPYTTDEYDVIVKYTTTKSNFKPRSYELDEYYVTSSSDKIYFVDTETNDLKTFDYDLDSYYLNKCEFGTFLSVGYDEENKTIGFDLYDKNLDFYSLKNIECDWWLDEMAEGYKLSKDFFGVYGDYILFGNLKTTYNNKTKVYKAINYKTGAFAEQKEADRLDAIIYQRSIIPTKYQPQKRDDVFEKDGEEYLMDFSDEILYFINTKTDEGLEVTFEDMARISPDFDYVISKLDPLDIVAVHYRYGQLIFVVNNNPLMMGFPNLNYAPNYIFRYDLNTNEITYINTLSTNYRPDSDIIGICKVPNPQDFPDEEKVDFSASQSKSAFDGASGSGFESASEITSGETSESV